jgi:hypothetical protein
LEFGGRAILSMCPANLKHSLELAEALARQGQGIIMAQTTSQRILSNELMYASMCMWWIINLYEFGKNLLMPNMQWLGHPQPFFLGKY